MKRKEPPQDGLDNNKFYMALGHARFFGLNAFVSPERRGKEASSLVNTNMVQVQGIADDLDRVFEEKRSKDPKYLTSRDVLEVNLKIEAAQEKLKTLPESDEKIKFGKVVNSLALTIKNYKHNDYQPKRSRKHNKLLFFADNSTSSTKPKPGEKPVPPKMPK